MSVIFIFVSLITISCGDNELHLKATRATNSILTYFLIDEYADLMRQFLNAQEVARLLNVHRSTVTKWIQKGLFPGAIRIEGTRNWRIPLDDYERFLTRHHESHQL